MLGRPSWWSSQSNGWKRCLKDYCTAYGGIINREKVTLPRCAGEDPTDEVPFVLSLCAAEKFIKSSRKKEFYPEEATWAETCFFFLLSMRRPLDLALSFLLFLYWRTGLIFCFMDLNTNSDGPDFPDHLASLHPSQLSFSSSPVDAIAWMLCHYIKVTTKQSLSSLSCTNFFQLNSICHLETSLLAMATSFLLSVRTSFVSSLAAFPFFSFCSGLSVAPVGLLHTRVTARIFYFEFIFFNLPYVSLSVISQSTVLSCFLLEKHLITSPLPIE